MLAHARTQEEFYDDLAGILAVAGRYGHQDIEHVMDMPIPLLALFLRGLRRIVEAEHHKPPSAEA